MIVLDDLENDENVEKPEQRDKLQSWLQKTVLNLGAADGSMDVVYVGTLLHYDSVLARTLRKPLWKARTFRSILALAGSDGSLGCVGKPFVVTRRSGALRFTASTGRRWRRG